MQRENRRGPAVGGGIVQEARIFLAHTFHDRIFQARTLQEAPSFLQGYIANIEKGRGE